MNGQTLQQTESLGSGAGNATEPTPIPMYAPAGWSTVAGANYGTVVLPGIVNASGVGTGSGTTLYVYTDANGKASITVQDGNVPYYNAYGVSTSTATTTGGTVGLGISGTSLELGTSVSGVAGQVSYGQQIGAAATVTGLAYANASVTVPGSGSVTDAVTTQPTVKDSAGNTLSDSGTYSIPTTTGVTIDPSTGELTVDSTATASSVAVTYTQGSATQTVTISLS